MHKYGKNKLMNCTVHILRMECLSAVVVVFHFITIVAYDDMYRNDYEQ